jgi:hypothetical protein
VRRTGSGTRAQAQLSWFNDLRGSSSEQTIVEIPPGEGWQSLRNDVTVPGNAVAVLPLLRLGPPAAGRSALDVDGVRLIEWRAAWAASLATDYLRVRSPSTFSVVSRFLPGWPSDPSLPVVISDGLSFETQTPGVLPPGPSPDPEGH